MNSAAIYVRQCAPRNESLKRPLIVWSVVTVVALFLVAFILSAPFLASHGYTLSSSVIYESFRHICHQISERSFHIDGYKYAVCARCFGIYAGFAGGVTLYPLVRSLRRRDTPARAWLIVATVPICVDFVLGFLHIWENTHWSRALTGALVGATAALYVVPGFIDVAYTDWRRFFARSDGQSGVMR